MRMHCMTRPFAKCRRTTYFERSLCRLGETLGQLVALSKAIEHHIFRQNRDSAALECHEMTRGFQSHPLTEHGSLVVSFWPSCQNFGGPSHTKGKRQAAPSPSVNCRWTRTGFRSYHFAASVKCKTGSQTDSSKQVVENIKRLHVVVCARVNDLTHESFDSTIGFCEYFC
jgi:hypothetical protein